MFTAGIAVLGVVALVVLALLNVIEGAESMDSTQLYEAAAAHEKAALAIIDKAKAENRENTEDEQELIDTEFSVADEARALGDQRKKAEDREARATAARQGQGRAKPRPSAGNANIPGAAGATDIGSGNYARTSNVRDRVADDPTGGFRNLGEFMMGAEMLGTPGMAVDERMRRYAAASGMSQGVGNQGGVTVPAQFSNEIWDGMSRDPDNLVALCDTYTVTGDSLTMPRENETNRGDGYRDGGVLAYWQIEAGTMTNTTPSNLDVVKLEPHELTVLVYVTNKLLRNSSVALGQYVNRKMGRAMSFKMNDAIINGTGTGMPLGILNSDALVSVDKEDDQVADTVIYENVRKIRARMHPNYDASAIWMVNQEIPQQLETMKLDIGTSGQMVYMPANGISVQGYGLMYGAPVRKVEYCAAPGDVGDIIYWAPRSYAVGLKGTPEMSMSIHIKWDSNQTGFKIVFEMDGQPWINSAVTPYKGTDTLSTMVTVAAR